jgi:uncharacterized protein YkwD
MRHKQYILAVVLGIYCGVSLANTLTQTDADQKMAADILGYVNQYRGYYGLSKLTLNTILSQEAVYHSADMAKHRMGFGHDGFSQRIEHAHQKIPNSQGGAENVAFNYKTAKIVVDGWMNSSGHKRNILGHYTLTGIGIARDSAGKPYFTQIFLKA